MKRGIFCVICVLSFVSNVAGAGTGASRIDGNRSTANDSQQEGASVTTVPDGGTTALHVAVQEGLQDEVELLIKLGANVNSARTSGATPLFIAAQSGQIEVAKLLIKYGANVNSARTEGATPLFIAVQKGYKELAELLIDKGADVNAPYNDKATPLFLAAQNGNLEMAKLLINNGARVNAPRLDGVTPISIAAHRGHAELVELLVNKGADLTDDVISTLEQARKVERDINQAVLEEGHCPICLDDFSAMEDTRHLVKLKDNCKELFCERCIHHTKNDKNKYKCPMCRLEVGIAANMRVSDLKNKKNSSLTFSNTTAASNTVTSATGKTK